MRPLPKALLLVGFVGLLNLNTIQTFFLGDDFDYLRWFRQREGSVWHAIHLHFWGEWEPAWYITWALDQKLWGLNPLGFHLQQILWLAVLVLALYGLVRSVWPAEPFVAWAAALLFAANPLHDEVVAYLAARGHVMCGALALLALWLYSGFRRPGPRARRVAALAGALVAAGLAALAKEIALLLPLWAAALEWVAPAEAGRRHRRTLVAAALFLLPAGATLVIRKAVVGLGSAKLAGKIDLDAAWLTAFAGDLPRYALLAGLPLPFGLLDEPDLTGFVWLGWLLLGVTLSAIIACAILVRRRPLGSVAPGLYLFAVTLSATSLMPVFWAGLPLRRRYLFLPSVGSALVAALTLGWLARRRPRVAALTLLALVVAGAAGTVYRNDLYRRSGAVARGMLETIRGATFGHALAPRERGPVVLVALPFHYGGDALSGAYLFHHTDFKNALAIADVGQRSVEYAMRIDHADDHRAELIARDGSTFDLRISFRNLRAFEAALRDDPAAKSRGDAVRALRIAVDRPARAIFYRVATSEDFLNSSGTLYLYSDDRLTPISP